MAKEWTWEAIEATHVNTQTTARVQLDAGAVAEIEALVEQHNRLREQGAAGLVDNSVAMTKLSDRIMALRKKLDEKELVVVFQGIGRSARNALRAQHPAPKDQVDDELYGPAPGFNVDTYPPALLAASCVKPAALAGNVEAWQQIHDTWNDGPLALFWRKCLAANQAVQSTPKEATISALLKGAHSSTS